MFYSVRSSIHYFLIFGVGFGFAIFCVPLVLWSIGTPWPYPSLLPTTISLSSWLRVFSDGVTLSSLLYSFAISIVVAVCITASTLAFAFLLRYTSIATQRAVLSLALVPLLIPAVSFVLGLHAFFVSIRLNDSLFALIITHSIFAMPYALFIFNGALSLVDFDYLRVARTLGTTHLQQYSLVLFPMIIPSLMTCLFLTFIISWSQYFSTLVIGGGRYITLPVLLINAIAAGNISKGAVYAVIILFPAVLFLVFHALYIKGNVVYHSLEKRKTTSIHTGIPNNNTSMQNLTHLQQ